MNDNLTPLARYVVLGFVLFIVALLSAVAIAIAIKHDIGKALLVMGILFGVLFVTYSASAGMVDLFKTISNPPGKRSQKRKPETDDKIE